MWTLPSVAACQTEGYAPAGQAAESRDRVRLHAHRLRSSETASTTVASVGMKQTVPCARHANVQDHGTCKRTPRAAFKAHLGKTLLERPEAPVHVPDHEVASQAVPGDPFYSGVWYMHGCFPG